MSVDPIEVIKRLMRLGFMFNINDVIEFEVAEKIAQSFGFPVNAPKAAKGPGSIVLKHQEEDQSKLQLRPPVVTILGHVDHGKTTLLDAVRHSHIVTGESGGITQHIGAYQVEYKSNKITFLDTPGHEAFTAMRARGAQVTDIAILVVAANDGIMPQTIEAINHVKAAGVPIICAINKIDTAEADPERVKRQLAEHDLMVEEWGGNVISVPVSALKGIGIDDLLENIVIVAEVGELKANPDRLAEGVVLEARIDKSKGHVVTVLVQTGTLRIGDNIVAGGVRGRIKAMLNDRGERIEAALPSQPVELLGMTGVPQAGDKFSATADEKTARSMVETFEKEKAERLGRTKMKLEEIHAKIESGEVKALNLVVKTDVQGSIEPILNALEQVNTDETRVNVIHAAAGSVTESDVLLGVASEAIIVGFNSRPEPGAKALATQEGVDLRHYDVIYRLAEDVQKALKGLLTPEVRDITEGVATVRAVFNIAKRKVAGVYVNSGKVSRGTIIHVLRGGKLLAKGELSSLKHFKDDVRELGTGFEGGLTVDGFTDFAEGDIVEAHRLEQDE